MTPWTAAKPEYTKFLAEIPTVWRAKEVRDGEIGEYVIVTATANDKSEYIAGLNGNTPRPIPLILPTDFDWEVESIEVWMDGDNTSVDGTDYEHIVIPSYDVKALREALKGRVMAAGGGYVYKITPKNKK